MSGKMIAIAILVLSSLGMTVPASAEKGRIYGRIHTDRGDILEGPIRWDVNEASWDDLIDGYKERTEHAEKTTRHKYGDRERKITIFGIDIGSENWGGTAQTAIAVGHIKELTPIDDDRVELLLKSGRRVTLSQGSTDFGGGIREIVIETTTEGELELEWDDIDHVEFFDGGEVTSTFGPRLYGTVTTSRAGDYTGWICWDMDEMFAGDVIDGSEHGRTRKIKFSQIVRIERLSSQASEITLRDGKAVRLEDSNDIDSGNRGILITDPGLGRVTVSWDEFETLELKEPPAGAYPAYADFDGGRRLHGTVTDEDGAKTTGYISWDDDEEYTWEILDGSYRGVDFDIPFEKIQSIAKDTRRTTTVTLWDGRQFRLRDSNDVNEENKGIFVTTAEEGKKRGEETEIGWEDFSRVDFSRK